MGIIIGDENPEPEGNWRKGWRTLIDVVTIGIYVLLLMIFTMMFYALYGV